MPNPTLPADYPSGVCLLPDGRVSISVTAGGKTARTITHKSLVTVVKRHLEIAVRRMSMSQ